jgi:hypothetical protein
MGLWNVYGQANWTDEMIAELTKRRGYDMKPWLPVLVGHVVESSEASDHFLFDCRTPATAPSRAVPEGRQSELATLEGPWEVAFQPNRGTPARITLDTLVSWTENADAGVECFSGAAAYKKALQAPAAWFNAGAQIWPDLGAVANIAEVAVNGKPVDAVWRRPFRVNLTGALRAGANTLEIKVTNVWVNRLIGDQQPGAARFAFSANQPYRADSPLLPSGLLGPVKVVSLGK